MDGFAEGCVLVVKGGVQRKLVSMRGVRCFPWIVMLCALRLPGVVPGKRNEWGFFFLVLFSSVKAFVHWARS